jgi:hypothetical protein
VTVVLRAASATPKYILAVKYFSFSEERPGKFAESMVDHQNLIAISHRSPQLSWGVLVDYNK